MQTTHHNLIHPTGWPEYLRYATHPRGASWRPPFLSLPIGFIERLPDALTEKQAFKYLLFLCAYADAPLIDPEGDVKGPRAMDGRAANVARTLRQRVTNADLKAWSEAGLTWASTDGTRTRGGLGLGLGEDLDSETPMANDQEREADDQFTVVPVGWAGDER
jgi:hypothetical protein